MIHVDSVTVSGMVLSKVSHDILIPFKFQGLVFQSGTHELFSCSFDRTIKIWNVDELTYIETL